MPRRLDLAELRASAALLPGEHDFRAFTPTDTQHEVFLRVVESAAWHDRGDHLDFEIAGDSFLRHMVRTLVGTMLELPPERIEPLLAGRPRSGGGRDSPAVRALSRGRSLLTPQVESRRSKNER